MHGTETADSWKSVELEWEPVENAMSYEVRLTPTAGGTARTFKAQENHLTQEVPVGTYTLEVRCLDKNGETYSPWSAGSTLEVAIKEIMPISPEDNSVIDAEGDKKQAIEFKWSPVDKVKIYTLKVWSSDKKDRPWIFTGTETNKKLAVPPGQVYYWQVSFESANETDYVQQPKVFSFTVQGTKLLMPEITRVAATQMLKWPENPDASEFKLRFFYHYLDETEWTLVRDAEVTAAQWPAGKLKAGMYKVEVIATAPRRMSSDPGVLEFTVKPSTAELTQALAGR